MGEWRFKDGKVSKIVFVESMIQIMTHFLRVSEEDTVLNSWSLK